MTKSSRLSRKKSGHSAYLRHSLVLVYGFVNLESSDMIAEFGARLRKIREDKGLSQADLAEKAGMQPSAISHFESGRRAPSFDNLKRLADALSITIDFLIGRQPQPHTAGPAVDNLFRNFEKLTAEDQDTVAGFAKMLAERNKIRHEGDK